MISLDDIRTNITNNKTFLIDCRKSDRLKNIISIERPKTLYITSSNNKKSIYKNSKKYMFKDDNGLPCELMIMSTKDATKPLEEIVYDIMCNYAIVGDLIVVDTSN